MATGYVGMVCMYMQHMDECKRVRCQGTRAYVCAQEQSANSQFHMDAIMQQDDVEKQEHNKVYTECLI